jgi:LmbE family N-acetylglucosaminyl deacetylase
LTKKVLILAAHPDDEILGLGGTVARHVSCGDEVTIALIADHGAARYDEETINNVRESARQAAKILGVINMKFAGLVDQRLDTLPILDITQQVEKILKDVQPHIIYTHHRGDINRDHQVVYEATLTAARPYSAPHVERILCYETPSSTEWSGPHNEYSFVPNVFVDITNFLDKKLKAMSSYQSELLAFPHPRSLEALKNRAAHWGSVMGVEAAEPFILVREFQK